MLYENTFKKLLFIIQAEFKKIFAQNCFQILNGVNMSDRRRFGRFLVAEGKYQLVRQDTGTIGWIVDINQNGLSYEHMAINSKPVEQEEIGIISEKNRRAFLPGLSCNVIYDIKADEKSDPYSPIQFRRRGLKYRKLTRGQLDRLTYLLNGLND